MKSKVSNFNIESYGQDLRFAYLADLLEFEAYRKGASRSKADLGSFISTHRLSRLCKPRYMGDDIEAYMPKDDDSKEGADSAANMVFEELKRRSLFGGEFYPFSICTRVTRKKNELHSQSYLQILFCCILHSSKIRKVAGKVITSIFEDLATKSLKLKDYPVETVGTSASSGDFSRKINELHQKFPELTPTIGSAPISRSAQDEGSDVFGFYATKNDNRHGQLAMIGQTTMAKSCNWATKIPEPKPALWGKLFGERIRPITFFITPHQIPSDYLHKLYVDYETCGVYFDRSRLLHSDIDLKYYSELEAAVKEISIPSFLELIC